MFRKGKTVNGFEVQGQWWHRHNEPAQIPTLVTMSDVISRSGVSKPFLYARTSQTSYDHKRKAQPGQCLRKCAPALKQLVVSAKEAHCEVWIEQSQLYGHHHHLCCLSCGRRSAEDSSFQYEPQNQRNPNRETPDNKAVARGRRERREAASYETQ